MRIVTAFGLFAMGLGTGWFGTGMTPLTEGCAFMWPVALAALGTLCIVFAQAKALIAGFVHTLPAMGAALSALWVQFGGSMWSIAVITALEQRDHVRAAICIALSLPARYHVTDTPVLASTLLTLTEAPSSLLAFADIASVLSALSFLLIPCVWLANRPALSRMETIS